MKYSVVVCVRNEESRLRDCLRSIYNNSPDEVILVDGDSTDDTLKIAREFPDIKILESKKSSLTLDRQKGIDAAKNQFIAMIDADHRLQFGDLESLLREMISLDFDIIQGTLVSFKNHGFWDEAEELTWKLTQSIPGQKSMIGTAPSFYNKRVFDFVRFDSRITKTIDDTDFFYRLSKIPKIRVGLGSTKIRQYHFSSLGTYIKKFQWYGKGDGEFCRKHPERMPSIFYHLIVRYPIIYSYGALRAKYYKAIPFCILQGVMRFVGMIRYFLRLI
jgi:glycosyltransferase involved in cell wall biosynthesis